MKRIIFKILIAASAVFAVSCQENVIDGAKGFLSVDLQRNDELILKSTNAPADDQIFSVDVFRNGNQVTTIEDYRDLIDNPLMLAPGTYHLIAYNGVNQAAAFDAPYYSGETDVKVLPNKATSAEIICSLANVKVTVSFDKTVTSNFSEYSVTVSNGEGSLTFSNTDNTLDNEGYFSVNETNTLTWTVSLKNNDGVTNVIQETVIQGVRPRQHYAFEFVVNENLEEGGLALRLLIDDELVEMDYGLILDFTESTTEITSEGDFDSDGNLIIAVGTEATRTLSLSANKGIKSLFLKFSDDASVSGYFQTQTLYELVDADPSVIGELSGMGIKVSSVPSGATACNIDISDFITNLPVGEYALSVSLYDVLGHMSAKNINIRILSDVDADVVSATPWAKFAIIEGKWFNKERPAGLTFQYRKETDTDWIVVEESALQFDDAYRTFTAEIYSLEPLTKYVFKAVSDKDKDTKTMTFTTGTVGILYNLGFDDWYQDGKVWYPDASASEFHWDTANGGTKILNVFPTTPEENIVAVSGEGKKAARLESSVAAGNLAAGNIYTGKFGKASINPLGATLEWGVAFSARPVALKGYYNYIPVPIDKASDNYSGLIGQPDVAQIQIMLTDWSGPYQIDTGNKRFVNVDTDPNIIAYGSLDLNATDGYVEFTIPLVYRDVTRTPKYIVVVGAASKYGDYFTGGVGSVLYLDEFELEYDPANLTPEQRTSVNYR